MENYLKTKGKELKLTTLGFTPIGTSSNPFKGTLDGGAKTISNLKINKSDLNNVGIFGYTYAASIYGLNLENIEVTGNNYVGVLVGQIYGSTVKEIVLKNVKATGNDYVGALAGKSSTTTNNILLKSGEITATGSGGYVYGLMSSTNSIIESVSLNGARTFYGLDSKGYYSNKCKLNGETDTTGFDSSYIDDIDYYTWKVETKIEGDTNKTGYYFDYIYSKSEVGLVNKNDTTNVPPFNPTEDNTSNGTCTAVYGTWISTCSPYTSGIHGGYAYKKADDAVGAACTGMSSSIEYYPAYRAKVTYKCN